MAALEAQAVTTNQGNSSICVCAALAMAATEGEELKNAQYSFLSLHNYPCFFVALDDVGIDASQRELQSHLVNKSTRVRKRDQKKVLTYLFQLYSL